MAEGDITVLQAGIGSIGRQEMKLGDSATSEFYLALLTSDHTLDPDLDLIFTDVSANEYGSSDGYTAGGVLMQTITWTYDSDNVRWVFGADDVTWSSLGPLATPTPGYAICYVNGAAASDDHLLFQVELGTTATNGGDYTVAWSTNGIFYSS